MDVRKYGNLSPTPTNPESLSVMEAKPQPSPAPPSVDADEDIDMKELFGDDSGEGGEASLTSVASDVPPPTEADLPVASLDSDEEDDGGTNASPHHHQSDALFRMQLPPKRILVAAQGPEETVSLPVTFAYTRNKASMGHTEPDFLKQPAGQRPILNPEFRHVTLPNVIGVQERPFDPATFDVNELPARADSKAQQPFTSEVGIESRMLPASSIRWKMAQTQPGGPRRPVSNTRLVKWSDGSFSLRIGDEHFEVLNSDTHSDEFIFNIPASLPDFAEFAKQIDGSMQINPTEGSKDRSSAAQIIRSVEENNQLAASTQEMVFAENPEQAQARARLREREMEQMIRRQKRKEEKLRRSMMGHRGRVSSSGSRSLDVDFLEDDHHDEFEGEEELGEQGEFSYESDEEDARRVRARMSERSEASAAEKAEAASDSRKRKSSDDGVDEHSEESTGAEGIAGEQEDEFDVSSISNRSKRRRMLIGGDDDDDD